LQEVVVVEALELLMALREELVEVGMVMVIPVKI
jgi:hypothetical protein